MSDEYVIDMREGPVSVDLARLQEAAPVEGMTGGLRVHPDDVVRVAVLAAAAEALMTAPIMRITQVGEYQRKMEYLSGVGSGVSRNEPGVYALVRLENFDEDRFDKSRQEISNQRVFELPDPEKEAQRQAILAQRDECWRIDGLPMPMPRPGVFVCLCGAVDRWLVRQWLMHDYAIQDNPAAHRFRYRCDVSMKCLRCGLVGGPWGVVLSDQEWEERDLQVHLYTWRDVQIDKNRKLGEEDEKKHGPLEEEEGTYVS